MQTAAMQAHASAACAQARLTSRGAVLVQQHADAPRFGRGGSSAPQRATYTSSWGVAPRGGVRHTSRRVGVHCTADAQSSAVAESPAPAPREVAGHTRNGNGAAAPASRLQREEDPDPPHCTDDDVLIELVDVHKSFGSRKVLAGANLVVRRGEAVGIIGPSGTGKSTILRIMAGLLEPDQGYVFVRGRRRRGLIGDETVERLRIGMVFQSAAMFDSLTVEENVGFTLYEHSSLPAGQIRQLVTQSLHRVGLSGVEDRYPSQLSGGMKKRAALARAIIADPTVSGLGVEEVVMYDEPTAGLDPIASTVVEDLMRDLHQQTPSDAGGISSYIVVTHQHSTIRRATDRLVFLHQGAVVWEGSAKEFDTSEEPIVRQFARGELNGPITY